jgi:glutaredoxin 3
MKVTIYSTATCPYCKMLKDYLTAKGVSYTEKLVDSDEIAKEEMMKASGGFLGVPFSIVSRSDGTNENVIGFDKGKFDQILA